MLIVRSYNSIETKICIPWKVATLIYSLWSVPFSVSQLYCLLSPTLFITTFVFHYSCLPRSAVWFQTTENWSLYLITPIGSNISFFWMFNVFTAVLAIKLFLVVTSTPNGAFIPISIYHCYLSSILMYWISKWMDVKHFESRNCLCFLISLNMPTTVTFLLCVLINIFSWFDFSEMIPGYGAAW